MENTDKLYNEIIEAFSGNIKKLSDKEKQELLDKINIYLAENPTNTDILFFKSMYYSQMGDYEKSDSLLVKILEIDPNCSVNQEIHEILKLNKNLKNYNSNIYENNSFGFLQKIPYELILALKLVLIITFCFLMFRGQ